MDFLMKQTIDWDKIELLIDTTIFSKDIVMKTVYNFLDIWYFFFSMVGENIKVQCKRKDNTEWTSEKIILDFSDELLNVYLRDKIEKENKNLREMIIENALSWSIDVSNYVQIETKKDNFDDEIENILKDLENDPELKIDENQIKKLIADIRNNDFDEKK